MKTVSYTHLDVYKRQTLQMGARTELFGLDANIGASVTTEQGVGHDASIFATVGKSF